MGWGRDSDYGERCARGTAGLSFGVVVMGCGSGLWFGLWFGVVVRGCGLGLWFGVVARVYGSGLWFGVRSPETGGPVEVRVDAVTGSRGKTDM